MQLSFLQPHQTALVVQGTQNDLLDKRGAANSEGLLQHVHDQQMIPNIARLASTFRDMAAVVVHVPFIIEKAGRGTKQSAPLYSSLVASGAVQRGSWGAALIDELSPMPGDFVVEKARENPFYNSTLETILHGTGTTTLVLVGALTNMAIEHTARHAADAGYQCLVVEDAVAARNPEWHTNSINVALSEVATIVSTDQVIAAFATRRRAQPEMREKE